MSKSEELSRRIGARVCIARKAAGMTQAGFAAQLGLSRPSVANIEAGRQDLPLSRLVVLAEILSLDLHALIAPGDLPPPPHEVTITRVLEVYCQTCGNLDVVDTAAKARQARTDHILATSAL